MARLTRFLAASVAVHAMALTLASASAYWLSGQTMTVLSVVLDGDLADRRATAAAKPAHTSGVRVTGENRADVPAPVDRGPDSGTTPARSDPTSDSGAGTIDNARAQIEARVRTDLARHFDYPWFARQRGWQGDVLLSFIVRPDGFLEALRVERGSGFALLDQSALDSLRRVGRIPEAADWLGGREIAMHVPVLYRIAGDR
jgi:periplasmic protein TonB